MTGRGSVIRLDESDVRVFGNPLRFHRADGYVSSHARARPPVLGAHTDEVLTATGFTPSEIAVLREDQVVG